MIDNLQTVTIEGYDFARVVGQHPNAAQAKVDQDLRADSAFALHLALRAQIMFGFLAVVKTNARQLAAFGFARAIAQRNTRIDLKSASGVMQVNEDAAASFGDRGQRAVNRVVAIASRGTERIAGEAMRMNAHQRRAFIRSAGSGLRRMR